MGECFIVRRGIGIDPDELSASAGEVLSGQKFYGEGSDEIQTGTMPNNPAMDANLNCGESKAIPSGYTPGGTVRANDLASQTNASATASDILSGKTAWVNGTKLTGTAASRKGTIAGVGGYWKDPPAGQYREWTTGKVRWDGDILRTTEEGDYAQGHLPAGADIGHKGGTPNWGDKAGGLITLWY